MIDMNPLVTIVDGKIEIAQNLTEWAKRQAELESDKENNKEISKNQVLEA